MTLLDVIICLMTICVALVLALYVTYLFAHRLWRGEKPVKSFARWLRELFDRAGARGSNPAVSR